MTEKDNKVNRLEDKIDSLGDKITKLEILVLSITENLKHAITYNDVEKLIDEKIKIHTLSCFVDQKKKTFDIIKWAKVFMMLGTAIGAIALGIMQALG